MRLFGAEEMAFWFRALAALQEDPFFMTSTHMAAHSVPYSSLRGSDTLFWHQACTWSTDIHAAKHPYPKIKINHKYKF